MSAQAVDAPRSYPAAQPSLRGKVLWTTGNLLMLAGLYLLLYVGGLFADEQYNLLAAQGGSDIALPEMVVQPPRVLPTEEAAVAAPEASSVASPPPAPAAASGGFTIPQLNNPGDGRELNTLPPTAVGNYGPSTIERIIIPRIRDLPQPAVDRKVVQVGWTLEEQNGQQVAVWEVAEYAVGHHAGSANPGQGGNIVLAGHSGGHAYPFNEIIYLLPGDPILLWSQGRQYQYTVTEQLLLDEIGPHVTLEQRTQNARYIEPTAEEMITLVTCWPLTGPDRFNQRVVVRAVPHRAPAAPDSQSSTGAPSGGWTVR